MAKRIEQRGYDAETTSGFLMRIIFRLFAEDCGLIPAGSFTNLLKQQRAHPEHLPPQLTALWAAMDEGAFSPALGVPLKKFNGYLFRERTALPVEAPELEVLIQAAEHDWTAVEPAIFGTLLERALNPKERSRLGAHYTPRAYVERLIGPAIMEPLRADWGCGSQPHPSSKAARLVRHERMSKPSTHASRKQRYSIRPVARAIFSMSPWRG